MDEIVRWAGQNGFEGLEVAIGPGSSQCDAALLLNERGVAALRQLSADTGVAVGSYALEFNATGLDQELNASITLTVTVAEPDNEGPLPAPGLLLLALALLTVARRRRWRW